MEPDDGADMSVILIEYLTPNAWSRGQREMATISALVIHWTANPKQGWKGVVDWWNDAPNHKRYGSTHAIADDLTLVETIPDTEQAYHVGSSQGYSKFAVQRFQVDSQNSPNKFCLGIEMCVEDWEGSITPATWETTVQWLAGKAVKYGLDPHSDILTHQQIVGWKECPKWFVDHPDELERMRYDVDGVMTHGR